MQILAPHLRLSVLETLSSCLGECGNLSTISLDVGESTGADGYIELSNGVLQVTCHTVDLLTLVTGLHRRTLQTVWSISNSFSFPSSHAWVSTLTLQILIQSV